MAEIKNWKCNLACVWVYGESPNRCISCTWLQFYWPLPSVCRLRWHVFSPNSQTGTQTGAQTPWFSVVSSVWDGTCMDIRCRPGSSIFHFPAADDDDHDGGIGGIVAYSYAPLLPCSWCGRADFYVADQAAGLVRLAIFCLVFMVSARETNKKWNSSRSIMAEIGRQMYALKVYGLTDFEFKWYQIGSHKLPENAFC